MRQTAGTIFGDNIIRDLLLHYLLNLFITFLAVYVMHARARRSYILIFEINGSLLNLVHTVLPKTNRKHFVRFFRVIETFVNWKKPGKSC